MSNNTPTPHDDLDFGQTIRGLAAGQRLFQRYRLKSVLGRGGMGVVWLADDEQLECEVALKFLPEIVTHDRQAVAELKREVLKSRALNHHHIVRVHDFVTDGLTAAISMEYVDGGTLSDARLDQPGGVFEVEALLPWVKQLCSALTYAHDTARLIHRDLKPKNLMLTSKGDLKVADFGISRSITDSASLVSLTSASSGSPPYMSPQQVAGEDPRPTDDIYAVGATLYELLTSRPPFYRGGALAIMDQVKTKIPDRVNERRRDNDIPGEVPAHWEETIAACLAKQPAQRPRSAAEVWERLSGKSQTPGAAAAAASAEKKPDVMAGNPESGGFRGNAQAHPSPAPAEAQARKSPFVEKQRPSASPKSASRKNPALIAAIAAAVAVIAGIVLWQAFKSGEKSAAPGGPGAIAEAGSPAQAASSETLASLMVADRAQAAVSSVKLLYTCCRIFATGHEGAFPDQLKEIVAEGLIKADEYERARCEYIKQGSSEDGYWYLGKGLSDTADSNTVMFLSKTAINGKRVVGYVDGNVKFIQYDGPIPRDP